MVAMPICFYFQAQVCFVSFDCFKNMFEKVNTPAAVAVARELAIIQVWGRGRGECPLHDMVVADDTSGKETVKTLS